MSPRIVYDAVQLLGLGLMVYGVAHWSVPAAYVVAGAGLVLGAYQDARRG